MTELFPVNIAKYYSYEEAKEHMLAQGVKYLGWLNAGISLPKGKYEKVFSNWSGSSCLYVDPITRVAYSVDMGD